MLVACRPSASVPSSWCKSRIVPPRVVARAVRSFDGREVRASAFSVKGRARSASPALRQWPLALTAFQASPVRSHASVSAWASKPCHAFCSSSVQQYSASVLSQATSSRARRCPFATRSEEHTSELQSLMRISYAVFCLKKKKEKTTNHKDTNTKK